MVGEYTHPTFLVRGTGFKPVFFTPETGLETRATKSGVTMPTFKKRDQEEMEKAKDLLEAAPAEMGFVKSLFFGRLKLDAVLPYPKQDPGEARRTDDLIAQLDPF